MGAAGLGESADPQVLVPGDPGALRSAAANWRALAERFERTGRGMAGVDTGVWQGPAREGFESARQGAVPHWYRAGDTLQESAAALERHADAVEWAQGEAVEAARRWQAAGGDPQGQAEAVGQLEGARREVAASAGATGGVLRGSVPVAPRFSTRLDAVRAASSPGGPPPSGEDNWRNAQPPGERRPEPQDVTLSPEDRGHILTGDGQGGGGHRPGTRIPEKTEFPATWSDDRIARAAREGAQHPDKPPEYEDDTGNWRCEHTDADGVTTEVIVDADGRIVTAYPVAGPGVTKNDENGDPQDIDSAEEQAKYKEEHAYDHLAAARKREEEAARREQEAQRDEAEAEQREEQAEEDWDPEGAEQAEEDQRQADQEGDEAEQERQDAEAEEGQADREREEADREANDTDGPVAGPWEDAQQGGDGDAGGGDGAGDGDGEGPGGADEAQGTGRFDG
jgi:hypothetical protein